MNNLKKVSKLLADKIEPEIKIAINDTCPMNIVLSLLRDFFKTHSNTQLKLFFEGVNGAYEKLMAGEVDLAITPVRIPTAEIETLSLGDYSLVPVCEKNFLEPGTKLTERGLKNYTQIIIRDTGTAMKSQNFGVVKGISSSITVNDTSTKKQIIESGLGWGRLPSFMVKKELEKGLS